MKHKDGGECPREEIGGEHQEFLKEHVPASDSANVHAAITQVLSMDENDTENDRARVVSFMAGDPRFLARMVFELVKKMQGNELFNNEFGGLMQAEAIAKLTKMVKTVKEMAEGAEKADDITASVIAKAKGTLH